MKKHSKRISIILTLVLIAALLVSCNLNKENTQTPQVTAEPNVAELTDLGKFVSVVPKSNDIDYSIGNEIAKQKIIESIANDKGVKLDFEVIELSEDDFTNELNQLLSSSTYIDSITADYDMFETYASLPGLIKPIDTLLTDYGKNLRKAIETPYWVYSKYNKQIYGVPSMPYPEESMVVTRGDKLYMFTTEPITSYSSLQSICKFYKMSGYEYPIAATWDQLIDIFAYTFMISPSPYTHTGTDKAFIMREQSASYVKYYLEEMKHLYDEGFLHPDLFTATEEQMKAEFIAGKSAIYVAENSQLFDDRTALRSVFPDAELQIIAPLASQYSVNSVLTGEEKIDKILMFSQKSQNSEALMTFLDWSYTSQLNHTMVELGAFGQQIMYNPALGEFEYLGDYTLENKPYDGLYTLGLSTDVLYSPPSYVEYTVDIIAQNTLQEQAHSYLTETRVRFPVTVPLNNTAQDALAQYTQTMRLAAEQYIKGEITIDDYLLVARNMRNSSVHTTLVQEIGVPYLYKIGALGDE